MSNEMVTINDFTGQPAFEIHRDCADTYRAEFTGWIGDMCDECYSKMV